MATLSALRSTIASDIGRTDASASPTPSDARILTAINDCMNEIARRHDFRALLSTHEGSLVVGETAYSLPTRCKDIYSIRVIDGQSSVRLKRWHHRRMDKQEPDPDSASSGKPTAYMCWGETIYLDYAPNDDYTIRIRFSKWPTPLSADGDSPLYANMDDVIRAGTILQLYKTKALYGDGKEWEIEFEKRLAGAIKADKQANDWVPEVREYSIDETSESRSDDYKDPHVMSLGDYE